MQSKKIVMTDKVGFHTRTASTFSKAAAKFQCDVTIRHNDTGVTANGKSMLMLMALGVKRDHVITLETNGSDEEQALDTLCNFVADGF